jgi:multiple sugar transport system substrate-binding protein
VFDDPEVRETYPMADVIRESIDDAVPRPVSPFWTDVSSAIQRTWHPEQAVDPDSTPASADDLILGVLNDEQLL